MPKPTFLYSTHARWYVCLCSRGDRFAVVVHTPSRGDCFADIPRTLIPAERFRRAADIVAEFYAREEWYRLPNEIRCREAELTDALRACFDDVPVRTDRVSRSFPEIDERFRDADFSRP